MELIYAWIDDLYNIRNTEFLLNKEFDVRWNQSDLTLSIEYKGVVVPPDFFGKNITAVNAIVGANGAGKSTFLSFLFSWIGNQSVRHLLLFKQEMEGSQKIIAYYNSGSGIAGTIEVLNATNCSCVVSDENIDDDLANHKFLYRIYLSNSIAIRTLHHSENCSDLSTTYLLSTAMPIEGPAKGKSKNFHDRSQFVAFTRAELTNQIMFIQEKDPEIYLGFDKYIKTVGVHFASTISMELKNISRSSNIYKYSIDQLNSRSRSEDSNRKQIQNNFLVQCIFILHLLAIEGEQAIEKYKAADNFFPTDPKNKDEISIYFNSIKEFMTDSDYKNLYEYTINEIDLVSCNASLSTLHFPYPDLSFHLTFFQVQLSLEATKRLLKIYDKNTEWGDFIQFHWNMSAGENAAKTSAYILLSRNVHYFSL